MNFTLRRPSEAGLIRLRWVTYSGARLQSMFTPMFLIKTKTGLQRSSNTIQRVFVLTSSVFWEFWRENIWLEMHSSLTFQGEKVFLCLPQYLLFFVQSIEDALETLLKVRHILVDPSSPHNLIEGPLHLIYIHSAEDGPLFQVQHGILKFEALLQSLFKLLSVRWMRFDVSRHFKNTSWPCFWKWKVSGAAKNMQSHLGVLAFWERKLFTRSSSGWALYVSLLLCIAWYSMVTYDSAPFLMHRLPQGKGSWRPAADSERPAIALLEDTCRESNQP